MNFKLTSAGRRRRMSVAGLLPLTLLCALAPATAAARTVTAGAAGVGACQRGATDAAGRDAFRVTAPSYGIVSVRLRSAGDWDVAVFGAKHRLVAASAGFAGNELAEGFVRRNERLIVRACRYRGDAATADVSVGFTAIEQKSTAGKVQVVDVLTRQQATSSGCRRSGWT